MAPMEKRTRLGATLGERVNLELPPEDDTSDPLPSLDPPAGAVSTTVSQVARTVAALGGSPGISHVAGVAGCASALVARAIGAAVDRALPVICVAPDLEQARQLAADIAFLWGERDAEQTEETAQGEVLLLAANEASPYADINPDRRAAMTRVATLFHLEHGLPFRFLVTSASGLARKVIPHEAIASHSGMVAAEQELDRDALASSLSEAGYLRVPLVEDPGTFAVRGSVLDVWPPGSDYPVRVELLGDMVLALKLFDPDGQRTIREVREVWLPPAREAILTPERVERSRDKVRAMCDAVDLPSSRARALADDVASGRTFYGAEGMLPACYDLAPLWSYLPDRCVVMMEDPSSITRAIRDELGRALADEAQKSREPHFPVDAFFESETSVRDWLQGRTVVALHRVAVSGGQEQEELEVFERADESTPTMAARDHGDLERAIQAARARHGKAGALEPLAKRIESWHGAGMRVAIAARAETQAERLVGLLRHREVLCKARAGRFEPQWLEEMERGQVLVVVGTLARGVVAPLEALVLVTEEEIFGRRAKRRANRAAASSTSRPFIEDLRSLSTGDLVVHVEHGIGRYHGLVHKPVSGMTVDFLVVEYAGGDKLYLPVYRLNQIQKYAGGDATQKLDRLGGQTFARTRSRVARNVRQMADELLRLYAERQAILRKGLPPADDDYQTFEATFPFEETPDQGRAIADVMRDLERESAMDRLVCGDVGFGKTEVAIRAAFRVAMQSRQVAVLCPTTVLAQQHLLSFTSRMRGYAMEVRGLSRFQSKAEQDAVVRGLRAGSVDIVVGTHRLLSKDVHFKALGLLVVDEEQRFGVTHKERIKQLKRSVDVVTLSATPIPRTMQMAVSGLRDVSIITTPPVDRRAIRTIITRQDDKVIREAVRRELSRGGQVFYVYNRIEGLYERAAHLQELVPESRIAVAHGQMSEASLERTMLEFMEGRYDVLATTSIIENGLDIPRANTIVIDRADMFGLAQLYQLRGRVGRSKERAYCYLVVPPVNAMTEEARARVEAIEQHTDLGSGFHIASLDLELRGAGDLLGAEQSGNVASVGFDLFRQMLEDAVHELRGEAVLHDIEPEINFDVEAFLPEDYIADIGVRLSFYKRLASATDELETEDLALEMQDRFGPAPEAARRLVHLMRLKTELRKLRVVGCEAHAKGVTLHLAEDHALDASKLVALVQKKNSPFKVSPDMRLTRKVTDKDTWTNGLDALETLLAELAKCGKDGVSDRP
ncbi:MAG: transcription-repair coupling factor [Deltaproteobacteria bacterium]|nr:transcription-repair coupling factor [Deltaproteobacteria bacterium]